MSGQAQEEEVVRGMLDKQRVRTFVLGGIAGALAGIFFAPRSGKEFRGSIASRAGEARERGRETYFEAQERVQERLAGTRERSFGPTETRGEEAAAEALPTLGAAGPEPRLDPEPLTGRSPAPPSDPPASPSPLRDVSRNVPETALEGDQEEIRRKIRETRSRLKAHLESSEDREDG